MISLDEAVAELASGLEFFNSKHRVFPMPDVLAPLADTHGHMTSFEDGDPALVLARASFAGVRLLAVPGDPTDDAADLGSYAGLIDGACEQSSKILDRLEDEGVFGQDFELLGQRLEHVRTLAGIHPYNAEKFSEEAKRQLDRLLDYDRCIGVGEIGLDYHLDFDREAQKRCFEWQLALAVERNLPTELHLRNAADDLEHEAHRDAYEIITKVGLPEAGLDLHCFTHDAEVMKPFVEMGCYIAFGGAATFNRSDDIRLAAALCPSELILSETDCPYMAPVPLRGCECEPAMIAFTVARLAELRASAENIDPRSVYLELWNNACRFFGLPYELTVC